MAVGPLGAGLKPAGPGVMSAPNFGNNGDLVKFCPEGPGRPSPMPGLSPPTPAATPPRPETNSAAKASPGAASVSQIAQADSPRHGFQALLPARRPIVMFDRTGKSVGELAPAALYYGFRLSPDGKLLALDLMM